jgi:hypothetical protein
MTVTIPVRITFAPGATSGTESGQLAPQQRRTYVLRALEGQRMRVELAAAPGPAQLVIYGVDGTVLKSGMGEEPTFEGTLPSTQDYVVAVRAGEVATAYTLEVEVE